MAPKNNKDHKMSPSKKDKKSKIQPTKKKSKQGKMDIKNPFNRIIIYETESESDNASDSNGDEQSDVASEDDEASSVRQSETMPGLEQLMKDKVGQTGHNILMASLKNKGILFGKDCGAVLAFKPGKDGGKKLKGAHLERHKGKKKARLCISQVIRAGAHLQEMSHWLQTQGVHLNNYQEYVELASDIVNHICWILQHVALMENVDHGDMMDYFNRRFADLRNRRNYIIKK